MTPYVTPTPKAISDQVARENMTAGCLLALIYAGVIAALIVGIWTTDWRWLATSAVLAVAAALERRVALRSIRPRIEELRTAAGLDNTRKEKP